MTWQTELTSHHQEADAMNTQTHVVSEPNILYFGTPVALISTLNEDGSANLAPISSIFWLGWRCIVGIASGSKNTENILRTGECVLNLPSSDEADAVDRLARTTGTNPVPEWKKAMGYVYEPDKFGLARMTKAKSDTVAPPRAQECPVQMEAVLAATHGIGEDSPELRGFITLFELRVTRVHVLPELLMENNANRVDPDKWSPLIMSFQKFYGLANGQVRESKLSQIPEQSYRSPDVDRARATLC